MANAFSVGHLLQEVCEQPAREEDSHLGKKRMKQKLEKEEK